MAIGADGDAPGTGGSKRLTNLEFSLESSVTGPRLNDPARRLLSLLGVLPDGIAWQDLDVLLPGRGARAAADLRRVGLAFDDEENRRLRVLAPVREYTHLRHPPLAEGLDSAVDHFHSLAAEHGPNVGGEGGAAAVARLASEVANLDAIILLGLEADDPKRSIRAACNLVNFIRFSGLGTALLLEQALVAAQTCEDKTLESDCTYHIGEIARRRSEFDRARSSFEAALTLYKDLRNLRGEAKCRKGLGAIEVAYGRYEAARDRSEKLDGSTVQRAGSTATATAEGRPTVSDGWATSPGSNRNTRGHGGGTWLHESYIGTFATSVARPTVQMGWAISSWSFWITTRRGLITRRHFPSIDGSARSWAKPTAS